MARNDILLMERPIKGKKLSKKEEAQAKKNLRNTKKSKFKSKFIALVAFLILIYLFVNFIQVYSSARTDQVSKNTKVDAILVLGAAQYNGSPSRVLKARVTHALELYRQGVAPFIIVTGGGQPGDLSTEASASAGFFLKAGVPDEKILREVKGSSTYDSLRDTAVFAKLKGIEKVVIVTDGFHEKRAKLIADEVGLKAISSPAKDSPIKGAAEWKNFLTETARISAGRIIGFRRVSRDSSIGELVK